MRDELIAQARVKATLTTKRNGNHINSHNPVMLQHQRVNVDLQAFIDSDQCIRNMSKYAAKGEPRFNSATGILKFCVNGLHQTDPASSALRQAMIQVVGDRDFGSQETAYLLFGKPLYVFSFSFICVSLDGSRQVCGNHNDDSNHGDQALDPMLDHYVSRAHWPQHFPNLLQLNLVHFASTFYVTKGDLRRRSQKVVIRTFPTYSTNLPGKSYDKYCRYQLIKYKPWSGSLILYRMKLMAQMKSTFNPTMTFCPRTLFSNIFICTGGGPTIQ